jgi:hypothetical protein
MLTLLRMPDEIYQHELDRICLPHWALSMMHTAFADPHAGFYQHTLEFLHRNYNADASQMEYAFQLLQQDLVRGRVLISRRLMDSPAFAWKPASGDDQGRWQLSRHALPEHHAILQLTLDNAKTPLGGVRLDGAVETPSALARTFDKAKGAAKQVANDLLRRNAAIHAEWQAETGLATFTDQKTGKALSPDEVKQRWESEGKDALPIAGTDQQQGAQMAKDSPALGAAMAVAQTAASRGRNIIQHPDDLGKDIAKAMQGLRGPKDKQLSEALGKIGGEQAKRRQEMETDPRYVDRYHGPDDVARDKDGKLVELEYKGNKTDSTSVAKDNQNNRQGSKGKNKRRSEKMTGDKAEKVGQPSNRQGGPYTASEIDLWNDVKDQEGDKRHVSVHTNTETGVVRTYERDDDGEITALLDEFTIENFDSIKSTLKDLLK